MRRSLPVLLLLSLSLLLTSCARNPVTGQQQLSFMSLEQQIEIGRQQYPLLTQMYDGELQDPKLQAYMNQLGKQLAKQSHDPDLPYEFNIVNSSVANAYALPGGFISITRGLLLEMDSEEQLAAVTGHEIAHAVARHAAQQHARGVMASILLTAGEVYLGSRGVPYAGLYSDLGAVGAQAMLASYSRSQEQQSDRLGIEYMARAGYDPVGMVRLQEILLKQRKTNPNFVEQIFASHPLSEDRIEDSRQKIQEVRRAINIPAQNQLKQFDARVTSVWKPRKPAYEQMDEGLKVIREKKYREALTHFQKAIDLYAGEALFHAWKGITLTQMEGRAQEGRSALDRALDINDEVFRIRFYSAENHHTLKNYGECVTDAQKAKRMLPGVKVPDLETLLNRCQRLAKS